MAIVAGVLITLSGCTTIKVATYPIDDYPIREIAVGTIEDQKRMDIVMTAMTTLGKPYRWGGTDMKRGFDCSGLVYFAYTKNGVEKDEMPRVTTELAKESRPIKKSELKPGDLVFFNTLGKRFSHVGIYVGKGRFINAPSKGKTVRIDSLDNPYYKKRFTSARRLQVLESVAVASSGRRSSGG